MTIEKTTLLYAYDAFCGWCYGFSPVMKQLKEEFGDQIDFQVLSGGMVMGDRVGPVGERFAFIKDGMGRVEELTGVKFGQAFMDMFEDGTTEFNSEPPSIALTVFKTYRPNDGVEFAHALQSAVYEHGKDLTQPEVYAELAESFGLDGVEFVQKMGSEEMVKKTYEEFQLVQQLGINGFPAVIMIKDAQGYLLSRGYQPIEPIRQNIEKVLAGPAPVQ
ncbi:DsbA family protein [Pontibacter sp. G13]|uniref:DsbA family protein n=1 Tax=Pontibacter sp. G13 TaxID=3074898 RepID=UPI00288A48F4|nr:DsbA family protein [Pontibacter sp. G13]WNJ21001.1 DsbA family protein [Pontibacter sp. G13]